MCCFSEFGHIACYKAKNEKSKHGRNNLHMHTHTHTHTQSQRHSLKKWDFRDNLKDHSGQSFIVHMHICTLARVVSVTTVVSLFFDMWFKTVKIMSDSSFLFWCNGLYVPLEKWHTKYIYIKNTTINRPLWKFPFQVPLLPGKIKSLGNGPLKMACGCLCGMAWQ